ncbi:MAG: helix-turn-helix transcriptional regulator [Ectothiorhodospiraceae bacterium]|nr:helix-turn-helix transcriptional regulator [Ectothiorhodospiraceae bacterium]
MNGNEKSIGHLLQLWRHRRRLSQLALATEARISQRHLSFVESGRASPSRGMILHLAEVLDIPLRERNTLLLAAGFAPVYPRRALDDPGFEAARAVVERLLEAHAPYPALAIDRHWTLLIANAPARRFFASVEPDLLQPPVNVLRLSLHPRGLAPRIVNFRQWRAYVLARLTRQVAQSADPVLASLIGELKTYPIPIGARAAGPAGPDACSDLAVPLELTTDLGTLSFLSTTTVFGTPVDISLEELAIESFFPADAQTATILQTMADSARESGAYDGGVEQPTGAPDA